jgi:hypothetical protein
MTALALDQDLALTGDPVLTGVVRRASDLSETARGQDRMLPVAPELRALLPGLRRGSTVSVSVGPISLVPALLASASAGGAWVAVVGMPQLGMLATAQTGVVLERLALVPYPGPEWPAVVAALLDGLDVVVVAPPGPVPDQVTRRLTARARQRGCVLVCYGHWPGADLTLAAKAATWHGLGAGHGRLRRRELTVAARGRGAAARPRQARVLLPDPAGRLARPTGDALAGRCPVPAVAPARPSDPPPAARPHLRLIGGEAA